MMREDWIECKIGDTFATVTGNTPSRKNSEYYGGSIPFLKPPDISNKSIDSSVEFISNLGKEKARILPVNSVLVTCIGNLGRVGINPNSEVAFNQQINAILPSLIAMSKFIFYQAQGLEFRRQLEELSTSTTVALVNKSNFDTIKVRLPPLPIQRAIVKKIEQLFSALDVGIADLKKAQEQLKVYRQAVLKKAFEGELTGIEIKRCERIGSIAILNPKIDKDKVYDELECQFVPMKLVEEVVNKIHLTETLPYKKLQGKSYTYFANNDVIFAKVTPCMENGKIAVAKTLKNNIAFGSSEFHVLRCSEELKPDYLFHFLVQEKFRIEAEQNMTGAVGLRRVPKKFIEDYIIPLPSIDQQNEIVKEIEARLSVCDVLEQQINASLQQSEALRQSILKKAFAGELLTKAEIATCKKEPDYEPASVLLERIKEEKGKDKTKISKKVVRQKAKHAIAKVSKVSADIHAGLISKIIKLHEASLDYKDKLSHVKCEKIAHLVEYHVRLPLGRQPVKDAAGPDDYRHLKNVESRAAKAGFFKIKKNKIGYTYTSGNNIDKLIGKFESSIFDDQNAKINELLQLFLPFDLEMAEIAATTYAGWNNLIILGNSNPSDEEIVTESRENWSERKLGIPRERFFKAIKWMRKKEINLIPTGYGSLVSAPAKKKK